MERRFRIRLDELLDDAEVHPGLLRGLAPRLEGFLRPFIESLGSDARRRNATGYVRGLVSNLGGKTVESIAYLHDRDRQGLQKFIGQADWDHRPLLAELARQAGAELGEPDGVLVFDPSAFPKKGTASVGVQRQWCGRLGKLENCQVGVYLAYVTRREHALVDVRLYLPEEWARSRTRMRAAGVPRGVQFRTRHQLILDMLDERGGRLPHAWVSGDDELGRSSWFRQQLRGRGEAYLLAVPSNTSVRDLAAAVPYAGRGRYPKAPFTRVDRWAAGLPAGAWRTVEVRDAEKGPLVVQVARGLVQALIERRPSDVAEFAVAFRERQGDGTWKHDYLLSNAPLATPLEEFARVFKVQHRVEGCLKRAKGEAGLADYQVRTWVGWHHHQALSLIATWFLTQETRRGKKADPGADGAAGPTGDGATAPPVAGVRPPGSYPPGHDPSAAPERGGPALPLPTMETPPASTGEAAHLTDTVELVMVRIHGGVPSVLHSRWPRCTILSRP
jgi:SRSO17 transposase